MACPNNHSFFHMYYHAKRRDVNFYVDFAVESGGTVLEIGCGTGRILIPTTRVGINITGLDKSEEMLSICRRKLESEPPEVRDRVKVSRADMSDFNLESKFSLVTIPFGSFNCLVSMYYSFGLVSSQLLRYFISQFITGMCKS